MLPMKFTRTTLLIQTELKNAAERRAVEEHTTLQKIFNQALQQYLNQQAKHGTQRIVFKTHDLGMPLDNLKRGDYY